MNKYMDISDDLPWHSSKLYKNRDMSQIKRVVIHCTGIGELASGPQSSVIAVARYHVNPNHISSTGCPGICYHYMVGSNGTIFKTQSLEKVTWHAGVWNPGSVGICMTYDPMDNKDLLTSGNAPSLIQLNGAVQAAADVCLKIGLSPNNVFGHRELKGTGWIPFGKGSRKLRKTCPGLAVDMDKFRVFVATRMQQTLAKAGHYHYRVDGIWGAKSKAALTRYKKVGE